MKHTKGAKCTKITWMLVMTMLLSLMLGTAVFAAEVSIGNAANINGASAYTLQVGTEYYTTLSGSAGWLSFVTPAQEGYVTVQYKNISMGNWKYCYVKNGIGETLAQDDLSNGGSRSWEFKSETNKNNGAILEPNTRYYIQVGGDGVSGNAKLTVTFVADNNPNGKTSAEKIALNTSYTRSMDAWTNTDHDYFVFQATTTGQNRITISSTCGAWMNYELRKWSSDELVKSVKNNDIKSDIYKNNTVNVDTNLEAGQMYYLHFWHNQTGTYTFTVSNQRVTQINMPQTITLDAYQEYELNAVALPDMAYNKKLEYVSSNTDVANVNDSGKVYAYKCGFATITAKATDGSGVVANCVVIVRPNQANMPYVDKATSDSIRLKWNPISGAKGYVISYKTSKAKSWKTVKTTKTTYTFKKLNTASAYMFKIKAYIDVNGTIVYGKDCDNLRTCTLPAQTKITKLKRLSSRRYSYSGTTYRVKITWKKIKGAGSYKLYYRLPGNTSKYYYGTYTSNSAVFERSYYRGSSATKNMIFYVVPVKKDVGKIYEGKYSAGKRYKMH